MFDFSPTSKFEDICKLFHYCVGSEKKDLSRNFIEGNVCKNFSTSLPCYFFLDCYLHNINIYD